MRDRNVRYYYQDSRGNKVGPFLREDLLDLYEAGSIDLNTVVVAERGTLPIKLDLLVNTAATRRNPSSKTVNDAPPDAAEEESSIRRNLRRIFMCGAFILFVVAMVHLQLSAKSKQYVVMNSVLLFAEVDTPTLIEEEVNSHPGVEGLTKATRKHLHNEPVRDALLNAVGSAAASVHKGILKRYIMAGQVWEIPPGTVVTIERGLSSSNGSARAKLHVDSGQLAGKIGYIEDWADLFKDNFASMPKGYLDPNTSGTPAIAVYPNEQQFPEQRSRSEGEVMAERILREIRLLDACVDQFGILYDKPNGTRVTWEEAREFLDKKSSFYQSGGKDPFGNSYVLRPVGSIPKVHPDTIRRLEPFVSIQFWGEFR